MSSAPLRLTAGQQSLAPQAVVHAQTLHKHPPSLHLSPWQHVERVHEADGGDLDSRQLSSQVDADRLDAGQLPQRARDALAAGVSDAAQYVGARGCIC